MFTFFTLVSDGVQQKCTFCLFSSWRNSQIPLSGVGCVLSQVKILECLFFIHSYQLGKMPTKKHFSFICFRPFGLMYNFSSRILHVQWSKKNRDSSVAPLSVRKVKCWKRSATENIYFTQKNYFSWCLYALKMVKTVSLRYKIRIFDISNHDRGTWRVSKVTFYSFNAKVKNEQPSFHVTHTHTYNFLSFAAAVELIENYD